MKFAESMATWLGRLGYTHCFFVAGGNVMHLLDAFRSQMTCVPFVHEVGAGIAAEYFNEARDEHESKAFLLVTAGPGLTNAITAIAGAWLESRELLVIGGQVKTGDLSHGLVRQRGIQEIDGVALVSSIVKRAIRFDAPVDESTFSHIVRLASAPRKGPVFLELPLDVQAMPSCAATSQLAPANPINASVERDAARATARLVRSAKRPVLLIGGGVSRSTAKRLRTQMQLTPLAIMTTWNAADRVDSRDANYFGRPNTWGQRYANVLLQQADLIVAVGTRLGLQQTGFDWESFAPLANIVQVDIDPAELEKGHPHIDGPIVGDANVFLASLLGEDLGAHGEWIDFCRHVRDVLPLDETVNQRRESYLDPFAFYGSLSDIARSNDIVLTCSSGSTFTVGYQALRQQFGQVMITNKALASMGYGLSGAIGAALAHPTRRVIACEGDGGFAQNLQELATIDVNALDIKLFVFANEGYASIRTTQKNYFGGAYLGCDTQTGLGFPDWERLFRAYGIRCLTLDRRGTETPGFTTAFEDRGPAAFVVPIDPEQTYFPKISSRVKDDGGMESNPLHLMTPELTPEIFADVMRYIPKRPAIHNP